MISICSYRVWSKQSDLEKHLEVALRKQVVEIHVKLPTYL